MVIYIVVWTLLCKLCIVAITIDIDSLCSNESIVPTNNLVCSRCDCTTILHESHFNIFSNIHNQQENFDSQMLFELSYKLRLSNESHLSILSGIKSSISWVLGSRYLDIIDLSSVTTSIVSRKFVFNLLGINLNGSTPLIPHLHIESSNKEGNEISWIVDDLSIHYITQPKKYIFQPKVNIVHRVDVPISINGPAESLTDFITFTSADGQINSYSEVLRLINSPDCNLLGSSDAVLLNKIEVSPTVTVPSATVLCAIFTMESNHVTKVKSITDTWGRKCTQFLAFSTIDDDSIPSIHIPHLGTESYNNMWQKSRAIWKYIYTYYRNDFDYFLIGGDDMYYIMENLFAYLNSEEIKHERGQGKGLYLGRTLNHPKEKAFNSGGSGYILDSIALETLFFNMEESYCFPTETSSFEDVYVANCLRASLNSILPYNTIDPLNRQRFHLFTPGFHYTYQPSPHFPRVLDDFWYDRYDFYIRTGFDCCSIDSISFHFINDTLMYDIDNYLYKCSLVAKEYYYRFYGETTFFRSSLKAVAVGDV